MLSNKKNLERDWDKYREVYLKQKYRYAEIDSYNDNFLNAPNLEYTFLDFGIGIHKSLFEQYDKFIKQSPPNESIHLHSRIIEYAFLLDSSKNPLEKNIDNYELVPRGLYFLIDMVRRYKGMLVVRSGYGKVVFDFSDRIIIEHKKEEGTNTHIAKATLKHIYKTKDSIIHDMNPETVYFPGTMYSLVLPPQHADSTEEKDFERKKNSNIVIPAVRVETDTLSDYAYSLTDKTFQVEHPKSSFFPDGFKYISILFLYNEIIESLSETPEHFQIKNVYNRLFSNINDFLDDCSEANQIIFFDFAGFKSGNPSYLKILYFLINTPKINERNKAVIVNLPNDERDILSDIKLNLFGKEKEDEIDKGPFLYKPIPCINFNIQIDKEDDLVNWIGIKEKADEKILTSLLLGKLRKGQDNIQVSDLKYAANVEGSVFVKHEDRIFTTFSGYENIKKQFIASQKQPIVDFIKRNIKSGLDDETKNEVTVFLAANGGFQFSYISLYEILNDKYVARYFAKSLLDKYCFEIIQKTTAGENLDKFKFDKIVTVTVSSQLIGIALRDLIDKDPSYSFFKKSKTNGSKPLTPELIMLSSYYSFDKEKPFSKIDKSDNVLIVNDVISTGKLLQTIFQRIENDKDAVVSSVFSIVDTRIPNSELQNEKYEEIPSEYFGEAEANFFSLASFDDGIEIRKYSGPYRGAAKIIRINPLLNTVVGMDSIHSEEHRILFQTSDFINDSNIDSEYLKIGHFHQNLSHNAYMTDVRKLFASAKGSIILQLIQKSIAHSDFSISDINQINSIEHQLSKFQDSTDDNNIENIFKIIKGNLNELKLAFSEKEKKKHFKPDFIFYPIFSGIEVMGQTVLSDIFGTNPDNIIGLQRFDTPKGWRFPFPPKRFNKLTKNHTVLILDSGSLSGESLVQLIDGISFLDVKQIYMLSVITRIDDFNREFYSRLRAIKVKRLRKNIPPGSDDTYESIVPIQILFGIKLNIPVYPKTSCPFCSELSHLNNIGLHTHNNTKPNSDIQEYINSRIEELSFNDVSNETLANAKYLPVSKNDKRSVDTKELFVVRDLLGKVDNYRFYYQNSEYFEDLFNSIVSNEEWFKNDAIQQKVELILGCILHEPNLFELVDKLINNVSVYLKIYLKKILTNEIETSDLFYIWENKSLVKLLILVLDKESLELNTFERILCFDEDLNKCYPQYVLWDLLFNKSSTTETKTSVERLILNIEQARKEGKEFPKAYSFIKILSESYNLEDVIENKFLTVPFYNLYKFFVKAEYRGRHFALTEELNELIKEVSKTNVNLEIIKQKLVYINKYLWDINANIIAITYDDHFREYCSKIELVLGNQKGGMLYYISRFKKYAENKNTDSLENYAKIKDDLLSDSYTIVNEVLLEKATLKNFYSICKNYICSYKNVLLELFHTEDDKIVLKSIPVAEKVVSDYITCHQDIFKMILKEIIKNVRERYKDDFLLTADFKILDGNFIEFEFEQNRPFVTSDRIGGLTNQVKYYCEKFNGVFTDNSTESAEKNINYIITLKFKIHKYS